MGNKDLFEKALSHLSSLIIYREEIPVDHDQDILQCMKDIAAQLEESRGKEWLQRIENLELRMQRGQI